MLHIYAALAEKERGMIADRTRAALAAANTIAAEAFAANVLPIIHQTQAAWAATPRAVVAALNARGIRTARGGAWWDSTVRNVLARG